jgi:effector-binding domain-containing protein
MRRVALLIGFTALMASVGGHNPRTSCQGAELDRYTFRTEGEQTVLYRICRGDRRTIRAAVIELYALAEKEGIKTSGPFTLVALNNPLTSPGKHVLTEIRIPVDPDTVVDAKSLGPMTDVKTIASHDVAVSRAKRSQSTQSDRTQLALEIYRWIPRMDRIGVFGWRETFFGDYQAKDYDQMPIEVSVPVVGTASLPGGK